MADRTISLSTLADNNSCRPSRDAFKRLYGEGPLPATLDRFLAGAQDFDWVYGARHILTEKQYSHFRNLMVNSFRGLQRVHDPDRKKRNRAMASAFYKAYNSPTE